jgi:tetratricopeptide (TPR) repeat protein
VLGWPDRALARSREAVVLARRFGHPLSLIVALWLEAFVDWQRRDVAAQRERSAEVIALSETHGFPYFVLRGRLWHAAARVAAGEPEAITDLRAGIALTPGTGSHADTPVFLLLGNAYMTAARFTEAREAVEERLAVSARTGWVSYDAELHRLQGEITVSAGGSPAEAEACFRQALDIARAQGAKSWELRATTSLARLLASQGNRDEARTMLAEIYNWFTEGFDTADLKDAKALLDSLRA